MTIAYWTNFTKRKNSTKRPTGTGTSATVTLKETTSVEHPTFVLASNDFTINYVQAFGHYYFVDDIKSVRNGLIEVSCSMDVLATFKTEIGSYTAFIERSASHVNSLLPDPYVSMLNAETLMSQTTSVGTLFNAGGFYVISVLNDVGSGCGFTTYYATDISNIMDIAQYVNTTWGAAATDVVEWLQATFLKTADSIIDCIWVPFSLSLLVNQSATSFENIKIGVDTMPQASGYRFTAPFIAHKSFTISIPHYYGDFRKGAPYTSGKLFIPGYGMADFNPLDFGQDSMTLAFDADVTTGDIVCYLKDASGKVIATYTYNVAVACPVGKVGSNASGTVSGLFSTVAGIAAAASSSGASAVASGIGATASAANTLATAVAPTVSVKGGKGGRALASNGLDIICTTISKLTTDPSDLATAQGRMSMGRAAISTCSGFVKCSDAAVPIAGMEGEKEAVNNFLNSGFYYE